MKEEKKMIPVKQLDTVYAIRCFIGGKRVKTDALTVGDARIFRAAARHLARYLGKEYHLGK